MAGQTSNNSTLAAFQVASSFSVGVHYCFPTVSLHILALVVVTLPRSHNVDATQNTRAKSILEAINSVAKNNGNLITKVVIRITALDDVSVSTTYDVDDLVLTTRSLDGVGIMDEILLTLNNKND